MRLLLDMNLPPHWVASLASAGFDVHHWADVGDPRAPDREIMDWARQHGRTVLTLDLDFGTILALTKQSGPSVIQIRCRDPLSEHLLSIIITAIEQHRAELESGALLTMNDTTQRCRILPL